VDKSIRVPRGQVKKNGDLFLLAGTGNLAVLLSNGETNTASLSLFIFMSIIKKKSFPQEVYDLTRLIPRGKVTTYGLIAQKLKNPGAARAVGNALNKNPYAPQVPCHRVIRSNGEVGGFASGGAKKIAILKREGIIIQRGKIDLKKYQHDFKTKK
jgi:O-6-methylguanine DNA methyltransferase